MFFGYLLHRSWLTCGGLAVLIISVTLNPLIDPS